MTKGRGTGNTPTNPAEMAEREPFVSVVIPVLNDSDRLQLCLDALEAQSYHAERYEVIVVDNGCQPALSQWATSYPHVHIVCEAYPTSYAARNAGIQVARGQVIAFTDSDCVPAPNWIEQAAQHVTATDDVVIAGEIERPAPRRHLRSLIELYDKTFFLRQDLYAVSRGFGATANLVTRATAFESVGRFRHDLISGGDVEWCRRARARGFTIQHAPGVKVWHPTLTTLRALVAKARRVTRGQIALTPPSVYTTVRGVGAELLGAAPRWEQFRRERLAVPLRVRASMAALVVLIQLIRAFEHVRYRVSLTPLGARPVR